MDEEGVQGSDLTIPVGDVYIALIENGVLDRDRFSDAAEGEAQYEIGRSHAGEVERVAAELSEKLSDGYSVPLNQESEEWQEYLREADGRTGRFPLLNISDMAFPADGSADGTKGIARNPISIWKKPAGR